MTISIRFATRTNKSRLNFLDLLRAGHTDYVINQAALDYMRGRALAGAVIHQLATHQQTRFADQVAWRTHLDHGLTSRQCRSHRIRSVSPPKGRYGAASRRTGCCARWSL